MNITISYLWEKFFVAVGTLVGNGSLQERLREVVAHLDLLKVEDFPIEELRERFRRLMDVTHTPAPDGSPSYEVSVGTMTDDERREVANEIFRLFMEIAKRHTWGHFEQDWLDGRAGGPT